MKLYFLGTSGWYDTALGNTLSVLLDTKQAYIVFDAGGGFYKLDRYVKEEKPVIVLLSHFHLDHISGLHALAKFNFTQGIKILGPQGIKKLFNLLINAPYSMPVNKLKTKLVVGEFLNSLKLPVDIKYKELRHVDACYGYRVSTDNKTVVFCTDTGPCRNLNALAQGADVLIAESSLPAGRIDNRWPHLNPEQAAVAAKQAGVKKLILTHFDSGVYTKLKDRAQAGRSARKVFKNTLVSYDGLELAI
ncbi:MAG: MBL fold metallo-hydrolase [Candidatus Omnitrophica bacterium]|nr:MBL fold metallo-hydrolase [Candidatus Omnitrophota bacterium]